MHKLLALLLLTHGSPGSDVYQCLQDRSDFMWFCTNQGNGRFDGKPFKNFSKEDGLPDKPEKLRLSERMEYSIEVDEELVPQQIQIPAPIIQPFVENSIKHGITPLRGKHGVVNLQAYGQRPWRAHTGR